jgi:cell division protein FtsZ
MENNSSARNPAKIKVIGVGGGGGNAVNRMAKSDLHGVEFFALNTDIQALEYITVANKVQIGEKITRGLGCGGDPSIGAKAAEESREELRQMIRGTDMVFVACGMGGGTGTGAAPVVASLAKESGALTIGIVTKPFGFEGFHRGEVAGGGIAQMQAACDTLIIVPNDRLLVLCDRKTTVDSSFRMADDILYQGISSIANVITRAGEINSDFADVKAIMKNAGPAWLAIGYGKGQNRAVDAARAAISSPLLDTALTGATGVLYTVSGNKDLTLYEINEAAEIIRKAADTTAHIKFGVAYHTDMDDQVKITLIATGFNYKPGLVDKSSREEEMRGLRKCITDESQLDIPSFLRHPLHTRRPVDMSGRTNQNELGKVKMGVSN